MVFNTWFSAPTSALAMSGPTSRGRKDKQPTRDNTHVFVIYQRSKYRPIHRSGHQNPPPCMALLVRTDNTRLDCTAEHVPYIDGQQEGTRTIVEGQTTSSLRFAFVNSPVCRVETVAVFVTLLGPISLRGAVGMYLSTDMFQVSIMTPVQVRTLSVVYMCKVNILRRRHSVSGLTSSSAHLSL